MNHIIQSKTFLWVAGISCLLSVITTLGIHSNLFDLGELSFEQRLQLFDNTLYLTNRFWVIVHCLLVLIAMWGFFIIQYRKSPGFTGLGFVFFGVFSFTEIFRQMFVFFYLNNLRRNYIQTDDAAVQEIIKINMEHASLIGYALFGLFILAFALGCVCYGISLLNDDKIDRILGYMMLIWGLGNLLAFGNEFWFNSSIQNFVEIFSIYYQPIMRVLIGIWIIWKVKQIKSISTENIA